MITLLLIIVGLVSISAISALLVQGAHAPDGYEDATGFHFGKEGAPVVLKRRLVSKSRRVRRILHAMDLHLPAA